MSIFREGKTRSNAKDLSNPPPRPAPPPASRKRDGDFEEGIAFLVRNKQAILKLCAGITETYVVDQTLATLAQKHGRIGP